MEFTETKITGHIFLLVCFIFISCFKCSVAKALESVKIACITGETGIAVNDSTPMIQGTEIAIDEINKNGGLLGKPVELFLLDNKSTALGSKSAAEKAVKLNVTGVIGASWSSHSLAMAPVLQKAEILMITPASTDPKVTRIGNYIFRVCFTDELQGKIMANFARGDLKAKTAAVMENINEQYSLTLSNFFIRSFVKSGGQILSKENYAGKCVDFSGILKKVKTIKPDVIFIPGYSRDSGLAIRQAREMGIKAVFLGGDGWSLKIFDYGGDYVNGSYAAAPWHETFSFPQSRHLKKIFYEKFKKPIYCGVIALAYDAVNIFANAVKKAGTLDRKRIRDVLARTFDFHGATGSITFDKAGDPIGKQAVIMKFDHHAYNYVKIIQEKTIKIAAIFALTGRAAKVSKTSVEGIMDAVSEINKSGGIENKKIEVYFIDNMSTPIGSKLAAEKADAENVTAIIGSLWSSHSLAIAKIAQAHKIPMISNMSTNPKVTKTGNYIFRVCFTDNFQGKIMAKFAIKHLKAKSAIILTDITSDYSMGLSREFIKNFKLSGGKILFNAMYKPELNDYKNLIVQIKKYSPDVIFLSGHDESDFLAEQIQDAGIKAVFLGGDGWNYSNFLDKGGKYIKHGFFCTHWSKKSKNPVSLAFVKKYNDIADMNSALALSHDAVFLLADAIKRAHSINRNKIRMALENTKSFTGVTGKISFDKNGDPAKDAIINEINDGKIKYLRTITP